MSEGTTPTRRIGTRAVVRQENSAMAESEAAILEATSSSSQTAATLEASPSSLKTAATLEASPSSLKTAATLEASPSSLKIAATLEASPSSLKTAATLEASPSSLKTAATLEASPSSSQSAATLEASSYQTISTSEASSSSQTVSTTGSPQVVPKEEPESEPMETPALPVTTATTVTLLTAAMPVTTSQSPSPTITALQVKDALLLQPLGPSPFTGRKRKANFSNEETETLVKYVVKHFSALYGSEALRTESTRRNQRRSQLWNQIQENVNDLGYTPRSIDDLKHKWRDLRLEVKRKITHRRTASKTPSNATPLIDTKLTPLEEQVASTIGHHCSLDGEQEGLYIEPGVPRQSIFFNCRGSPGAPMSEIGTEKLGTASPRPELSLLSPLISTSPAQLSFVLSEDGDNEEQEMDTTPAAAVTPSVAMKPMSDLWPAIKELVSPAPSPLAVQQTLLTAAPQLLAIKQEVLPAQQQPSRCESQSSVVSSPEGSETAPAEWNGDSDPARGEMVKLKVEDGEDSRDAAAADSQDEWEGNSASPPPSDDAAPEDSLPSTASQDGDPPPGAAHLPANGDCPCEAGGGKDEVKAKMQRLLELEERWDRLYDQELGIWEAERAQQQQQRAQDRQLQQQLLSVLTDIRDELRQLRQERAAARQAAAPPANGTPAKEEESESPAPAAETTPKTSAEKRTPPTTGRRRGRPRLIKPAPEPVRPIRPAPGPASKR